MSQYPNLKDALKDLIPKKGKSNAAVARKLSISGQLLGQYLAGKRLPKTDFYLKWKEVFGEDLLNLSEANVSRETPSTSSKVAGNHDVTIQDYLDSLKEQKRMADELVKKADEKAQLASDYAKDMKEVMLQKLDKVDTNLSLVLGGVSQQSLYMESLRTTALKSLARLEKKKENILAQEADKIIVEKMLSLQKQGSTVASDKVSMT